MFGGPSKEFGAGHHHNRSGDDNPGTIWSRLVSLLGVAVVIFVVLLAYSLLR